MPNLSPDYTRAVFIMRNDCERCANAYRCDGIAPCEYEPLNEPLNETLNNE